MTKQDLQIMVQVCDAAMTKGGIIAADAMLPVASARQNALSMIAQLSNDQQIVPEKKIEPDATAAPSEAKRIEASTNEVPSYAEPEAKEPKAKA